MNNTKQLLLSEGNDCMCYQKILVFCKLIKDYATKIFQVL